MNMSRDLERLYSSIRERVRDIHLVDAHDHLVSEQNWITKQDDWTSILGYCLTDLANAGLSRDQLLKPLAIDARWRIDYGYDYQGDTRTPDEKWKVVKSYWPYVRHMGSGVLIRKVLQTFFDCDDLNERSIAAVQQKLADLKQPGVYRRLLREKHRIDAVIAVTMSVKETCPTDVIAPVLYSDIFSIIQKRRDIYRLEQETGRDIYSLETYLKALDELLESSVSRGGLVGIKWHVFPYLRDMNFGIANTYDAAKCFDRILQMPTRGGTGSGAAVGIDEMRPFQDLVQNHLIRRAIDLDIPVQVHAATLGGSYGGPLNGDPKSLIQVFLRYQQARFDILHAGFPWSRELGAICHLFPNVYINMAWLDILSPQAYRQFIRDWLTSLPLNKIFAFGADQFNILLTCACAERVRDLVTEALTILVADGEMTEDQSVFAADCILRKNAWEYWKLGQRWAGKWH
jgi:hypothetical protein